MKKKHFPLTQNKQPGIESKMVPRPEFEDLNYQGTGKLQNHVAIITGGDSGIGRAVAVAFAKEGANIVIVYLNEDSDAKLTQQEVEQEGCQCLLIKGDLGKEKFCLKVIDQTIKKFGKLDVLVNNAGEQHPQENLEDITAEQLERTFRTNIFSFFYLTKAALPYLKRESTIINTSSVTAYRGSETLVDYSATKGAIVSFTRSLALMLAKRGIRVNGVAPGPIWTPLIPSSFPAKKVKTFGKDTPMGRAGEPRELAPAYIFLASKDSSYMTGQMMHLNGGEIVNA